MRVLVVDYGMSNLGSLRRALEECDADVVVSHDPHFVPSVSSIVLPGVGAFPDGAERLFQEGWFDFLRSAVDDGIPLLGICLGMQLMATKGFEVKEATGLNLIPGEIRRMVPCSRDERLPHMGWNEIRKTSGCPEIPLLDGIPSSSDFYFAHSFHFIPDDSATVAAVTPFCGEVVSVLSRGRCFGVQFHPEKSGYLGFRLLRNFLSVGIG